jgi:hypothetical protein
MSLDGYASRGNLFDVKYNQDRSKAKKLRPPSGISKFYDVIASKDRVLPKIANA